MKVLALAFTLLLAALSANSAEILGSGGVLQLAIGRSLASDCRVDDCRKCVRGDDLTCQNCRPGYFNDNGKECRKCQVNRCQVCQEDDTCSQCKKPYTLNSRGRCELNGKLPPEDRNAECVAACRECDGNLCRECQRGYWNDNGYCKECLTRGCQVCQGPTGAVCTQCKNNRTPKDNGSRCS